jgi:hypothetical protein
MLQVYGGSERLQREQGSHAVGGSFGQTNCPASANILLSALAKRTGGQRDNEVVGEAAALINGVETASLLKMLIWS